MLPHRYLLLLRARRNAQRLFRRAEPHNHLAFVERAVAKYPNDPTLRVEYAVALMGAGRLDVSADEAKRAVGLDSGGSAVLNIKAAQVLLTAGDADAADDCIARAELARPSNPVIANQLLALRGEHAREAGDLTLAAEALNTAHLADPANAYFALDLARVLSSQGQIDDARAAIDRTLATTATARVADVEGRARLTELRATLTD